MRKKLAQGSLVLLLTGLTACVHGAKTADSPSGDGLRDTPDSTATTAHPAAPDAGPPEPAPVESHTAEAVAAGSGADPTAPIRQRPTGEAARKALHAHVVELELRDEHDASRVKVQHILISFAGAGTRASRTKAEAEQLAADVYQQVLAGSDFDALVKQYTDDAHPGIYSMTTGAPEKDVYPRRGMVAAFGNVGWRLEVGAVGVARFDPTKSPYGWHIIKRIE